MAVTAGGTPYVESSDLVANYPGASLALANRVDQVMQAPTQNAQTGTTYTAALLDAGKTVTLSNAAAVTLTIPAQATVAWVDNTQLNFLNIGAGTVTITPAATVTINGTPLTLATSKGGSLVRTASNTWTFIPFSGGVGNANFTDTATGDYTTGGIQYKFKTYTGSGSVTFDVAGLVDFLVVSGGGSGASNSGGGGGGGGNMYQSILVPIGTFTIFIGAGAPGSASSNEDGTQGNGTGITGTNFATATVGGGGGGRFNVIGKNGGSGGGGGGNNAVAGTGLAGQGTDGFSNNGGGGGAGAAATSAVGGAGKSSSITNTAVLLGGGGGGNANNGGTGGGNTTGGGAGVVNTGGGGGGVNSGNSGAGGSGILTIRVVV